MLKTSSFFACALALVLALVLAGGCGSGGPDPSPQSNGPTSVATRLSVADLFDRDTRSYYDIFVCEAQDSGTARVEMQSSDFDTEFIVFKRGSDGSYTRIDGNDDAGSGTTNSDDTFPVARGETYRIVATSARDRETGAYLIRFSEELGPPAQVQSADQASVRPGLGLKASAKEAQKK